MKILLVTRGIPGCIAGDVQIRGHWGNGKTLITKNKQVKIENIYKWQHDMIYHGCKHYDKSKDFFVKSYNEKTGFIEETKVTSTYSGKKQCYLVKTENQEVEVTEEHPFLTKRGWIKCKDLNQDDILFVYPNHPSGSFRLNNKKTVDNSEEVLIKYHPVGSKKVINGYTYYRRRKYVLEYEAAKNRMTYADYIKALNNKTTGLYFVPAKMHVHHINRNRTDNSIENVLILTAKEHAILHKNEDKIVNTSCPVEERLVSIVKTEIKDTYDLTCEENHNFFAGNILVHNCGKSTWIKEHDLEAYTLSPDNIRLLYSAPELDLDGKYHISAKCDKHVWAFLNERLEARMKVGDTTVIDATHTKESYLKDYKKLCKKYNYRMIVVDFSSVDLDTIKDRNGKREEYKKVPEEVIDRMYQQISTPLQGTYEIYSYDDPKVCSLDNFIYKIDGLQYKKVIVFGDLHNCYDPLKEYFDKNPISDQNLYIFVGDYFDRGIQGKEVLRFCLDNCEKDNFIFLTGNHEKWIKNWLEDGDNANITPDFRNSLEQFGELKSELSKFFRRLKLAVNVKFYGGGIFRMFSITHGGLSLPLDYRTPAVQCIKGVGDYEDLDKVEKSFDELNKKEILDILNMVYYNIHGHRNIKDNPIISESGYNINLEGKIEFGGNLRIVELSYDDYGMHIVPIEIKNHTFKFCEESPSWNTLNKAIIKDLEKSTLVHKKDLGDGIASYNFTREAFFSQKWNKLTTTARGLFVDTKSGNVIARSYPKFFQPEEVPSTQWRNLEKNLVFPITAYLKENGFLGIVSVRNDQLFIASKSTNQGEYADNFGRILKTHVKYDKLKEYLKKNNCSAIFECVDPFKDPHIIEYKNEKVVLLDIVQNDFTDTFKSYDEVFNLAKEIGCKPKEMCKIFNTFEELKSFVEAFDKDDKNEIEGFVFVDQNNFMLKYKTPYYKFWKDMRRMKEYINKGDGNKFFATKNIVLPGQHELMNSLFSFINDIKASGIDLDTLSIIDIRNRYLEENL